VDVIVASARAYLNAINKMQATIPEVAAAVPVGAARP
jgi:hypothetical protein